MEDEYAEQAEYDRELPPLIHTAMMVSRDPFIQALQEAHLANERAIRLGKVSRVDEITCLTVLLTPARRD